MVAFMTAYASKMTGYGCFYM